MICLSVNSKPAEGNGLGGFSALLEVVRKGGRYAAEGLKPPIPSQKRCKKYLYAKVYPNSPGTNGSRRGVEKFRRPTSGCVDFPPIGTPHGNCISRSVLNIASSQGVTGGGVAPHTGGPAIHSKTKGESMTNNELTHVHWDGQHGVKYKTADSDRVYLLAVRPAMGRLIMNAWNTKNNNLLDDVMSVPLRGGTCATS